MGEEDAEAERRPAGGERFTIQEAKKNPNMIQRCWRVFMLSLSAGRRHGVGINQANERRFVQGAVCLFDSAELTQGDQKVISAKHAAVKYVLLSTTV